MKPELEPIYPIFTGRTAMLHHSGFSALALLYFLSISSPVSAASVFLPDKKDGFGFNGNSFEDGYDYSSNNCSDYPLAECPVNAECSACGWGHKYKLIKCDDDYKIQGSACVAKSCSEINSAYKAGVPVNQVCSAVAAASGISCYQSCRDIDFAGYPLTECPADAVCTNHPDCNTTPSKKGNCSPVKKKIISCNLSSQKIDVSGLACVDKDDTCAAGYFKSCETGTLGTPEYTELGTACYQCKAACGNKCTLSACPTGAVCNYEGCSKKYCVTGCAVGKVDAETYWCGGALKCWMPLK